MSLSKSDCLHMSDRRGTQSFYPGDKFEWVFFDGTVKKTGVVERVRDDKWEQKNAEEYHYSVLFDDDSFETYMSQSDMRHCAK